MDRDQLTLKLGNKIAKDVGKRKSDWQHIVMVGRFEDDDPSMKGFAYLSSGTAEPIAPMDFDIFDVLTELRQAMAAEDGGDPWLVALFRIDRSSGELNGEFEYDDPERWTITLKNSKDRAKEFRPTK